MIGRTISHYEILKELGRGGMGQVYKARDTRLNISRALKFIHPHLLADREFKLRFLREAQAAATLEHNNICTVHEAGETESGRPFLCMTYYEGEALSTRLEKGPLPLEEVLRIGCSVGRGLACAHRQGIFHRDIKPENVLITTDGTVKILDFGLAKLADRTQITTGTRLLGTPRYMSPEQIRGRGVDHRTDIWSLGVILYQMAAGQMPFGGENEKAVFYGVLHEDPRNLAELNPKLPDTFVRFVHRCLEKDPADRFQSVEELLEELLPCAAPGRRTKHLGLIALGAAVVLGAIAAANWWINRPPALYQTETRLAVMPLENLALPALDGLSVGLTELVTELMDEVSEERRSMWVVPSRLVRYAELGDAARAGKAFGVNRIVTGNLQRHADGHLLQLVLRDAGSTERLRSVSLSFDTSTPQALADSLPWAIAQLAGLETPPDHLANQLFPAETRHLCRYLEAAGALVARDPQEAVELLRPVAIEEPDFAGGIGALGWACWQGFLIDGREARLDSALALLGQANALAPEDWHPLYRIGEVNRLLSRNDEALVAFEEASRIRPGFPLLCDRRARVLRALGRRSEAEAALVEAVDRRSDYFEVHRLLGGHFYSDDNEQEAAVREYLKTIELAPDDSFAHQRLGALYDGMGDFPRARQHFERAFQLVPNLENVSNVGKMCYTEEKFDDAARYYELALEMGGEQDYETWGNLAIALYWAQGRRSESVERFTRAIELLEPELESSPGDIKLVSRLIEYNAMAGREAATRELIRRYKHLSDGNGEMLYRIGDAYELLGDRNAALRYLSDAIRHGYAAEQIQSTKELEDLWRDPIFQQMIKDVSPETQEEERK